MNKLAKTGKEELKVTTYNDDLKPSLDDFVTLPIDLCMEYWSPEHAGESKRLYFQKVILMERIDPDGQPYEAEVAIFIDVDEFGNQKQLLQQSTILVNAVKAILPGTPLQVTYTGTKKAKVGNMSTWHISPLVRKSDVYTETQDDDDIFGEAS